MRYRITHRTSYQYTSPVHESFNEVRLRPRSDEHQTCLDFELSIDPPASVISFIDYYGNAVNNFSVPYQHEQLSIEATSDIFTFAEADEPIAGPSVGADDHSPSIAKLAADDDFGNDHSEFLIPSHYVDLEPKTAEIAGTLLTANPEMTAWQFLNAAAGYVSSHLTYEIGSTNVHSRVDEVLAIGRGVCQDFSHVLIGICRQAGLPARYVSGYQGGVSESEASHAWVEALVPPYGWVGFDATIDSVCTGRHVKVAIGRDYADVTVVRGTYRGGQAQALDVSVTSEELADDLGLIMRGGRKRGELMQFQLLGAMRQFQQLNAGRMVASTGVSPDLQTMPEFPHALDQETAPHSQPQQQQQAIARVPRT